MKLGVRGYSSVLHEHDRTASQASSTIILPNNFRTQRTRRGTVKHLASEHSSNSPFRRHRSRPPSVVSLIYEQNCSFGNWTEQNEPIHPVNFALLPITVSTHTFDLDQCPSESELELSSPSISSSARGAELGDHRLESSGSRRSGWLDPNFQDWFLPAVRPTLTITDLIFQPPEPPQCTIRNSVGYRNTLPADNLDLEAQSSGNMMTEPVSAYSHIPGSRSHPSVNIVDVEWSEDHHFLTSQLERISLVNNRKTNDNDAMPNEANSSTLFSSQRLTTQLARPEGSGMPGNTNQNFLLNQLLRVPQEEDLRKRAVYPPSELRSTDRDKVKVNEAAGESESI